MKKIKVLIVLVLLIIVSLIGLFFYVQSEVSPKDSNDSAIDLVFTISENDTTRSVLEYLEENEVIKNADIAYYYTRFFLDADLKAGDFNINSNMSISDIITYLSDANNAIKNTVTITFPEGNWLKDYARLIEENTNITSAEILSFWNNEEVVRSYMEEYPFLTEDIFDENVRYYLEGYLFPDTYEFYRETTCDAITRRFLDQTLSIYRKHIEEINQNELSIHEIFTLASIVQYEASTEEDMRLVAGVFLNRLEIGMPLQSSVTVCYAMDIEDSDSWTACEYNSDYDNPYNTYMYYGLTPGPILNPGELAIDAVLNPTESDYLFFMADVCGDGTVYYSEDYATHQSYINQFACW